MTEARAEPSFAAKRSFGAADGWGVKGVLPWVCDGICMSVWCVSEGKGQQVKQHEQAETPPAGKQL